MIPCSFAVRLLLPLSLLLTGCADHPATIREVVRTLTPETMQIGVTAPNLFAGPIVATKGTNNSRRDSVGQVGGTLSFTWRLKPIRIERAEVQPARTVPVPAPIPQS